LEGHVIYLASAAYAAWVPEVENGGHRRQAARQAAKKAARPRGQAGGQAGGCLAQA